MKILLIAPSSGRWRQVGRSRLFNGRTFRFSLLSLLSVAAETPRGHTLRIIDEQFEDVPWDADADLVGVTCMTALAPRAYEIADFFRARGIPVVLGGMHPTFCPDEALQHADAVVAGDAEGVWPQVVEDAKERSFRGVYRSEGTRELRGLKRPPYHLLRLGRYSTYPVQATRGCPHRCAFCAITAFSGGRHRKRPIDEIIDEVAAIPSRSFIFVDDNLTADRDYAQQLFEALRPLRKMWITQSSLDIAEDSSLVRKAADAGCVGLFVGLETFSKRNLACVNKTINRVDDYREAVKMLHAYGIGVEAGVVFGFDGDDAEVFSHTVDMLDELEIDLIQASIFTPLPGTPQFEAMQDRILDRNWQHYDFHHVVFEPKGMSAESLQAGHDWVTREFYRPWRIARRMARHAVRSKGTKSFPFAAAINGAYYGRVRRWHIEGWDPASQTPSKAANPRVRLQPVQAWKESCAS
ncbi:MAG: B12-binding domain-containing radical SAM protein [Candidatus Omnitrophica bacterium]|nr:B12-binding domain-containing radical SAM protein [Candidatus Omnitrophota bacterium]